jgi:hypothetical protein
VVTAAELLNRLRSLGVELRPDGDRIRWQAPVGVLTSELHAAAKALRNDLLVLLTQEPITCVRCGAGGRLVPTYWSRWREALCPSCVDLIVERFDHEGWPPVPWDDDEVLS